MHETPLLRFWLLLLLVAGFVGGCTPLTLRWTDLDPKGRPAEPSLLVRLDDGGVMRDRDEWEAHRGLVKHHLQMQIYGVMPSSAAFPTATAKLIDPEAYGGLGRYEEYEVSVQPDFVESGTGSFTMALVVPREARAPVPVIMMQSFCPRWSALPHPKASAPVDEDPTASVPGIIRYVFGRYICRPPIEEILQAGFAIALVHPGDFVPDHKKQGLAALAALSQTYDDDQSRWGAIAAWGWVFSQMVNVLQVDPRLDGNALIAYGHSRYGKSALVAAAFDERIAGVIAHQSGTGGASLNRAKLGESIASITKNYPHWFAKSYAGFAKNADGMGVDQHHLLGLIAPRPVLLGNARRDVWSDPNGAFRAAQGASPAYALYGKDGLNALRLTAFKPDDDIAYWMRPGTHGVVEEDWPAFLAFLTAHFPG